MTHYEIECYFKYHGTARILIFAVNVLQELRQIRFQRMASP